MAFPTAQLAVPPNAPKTLFREPTPNKYHVDTSRIIGGKYEAYIDGICEAISDAIDKWMSQAVIFCPLIMGPIGLVLPGNVVGPPIMGFILSSAPKATPMEAAYSRAISTAIGLGWLQWHSLLVGNLLFPPDFAVFPGPVHPPTPCLPKPLITFVSAGEAFLTPAMLKSNMEGLLGSPKSLHSSALFSAVSKGFFAAFQVFKATTIVQGVNGGGPVPVYAPPVVPAGPVLGGTGVGRGAFK
jgi:hypothetical protein